MTLWSLLPAPAVWHRIISVTPGHSVVTACCGRWHESDRVEASASDPAATCETCMAPDLAGDEDQLDKPRGRQ